MRLKDFRLLQPIFINSNPSEQHAMQLIKLSITDSLCRKYPEIGTMAVISLFGASAERTVELSLRHNQSEWFRSAASWCRNFRNPPKNALNQQ
jgi:hypothetical protein